MALAQISPCNQNTYTFSWMMSSARSTDDCAFLTIVGLITLTTAGQILTIASFAITLCHFGATQVTTEIRFVYDFKISVIKLARIGTAAAVAAGLTCVLVIMFPAYGRCPNNPSLDTYHFFSVVIYLNTLLIAAHIACACIKSVFRHGGIATKKNKVTYDYCNHVVNILDHCMPYVFFLVLYHLALDSLSNDFAPTEIVETNLAKWEICCLGFYTLITTALAVLLYNSETTLHLVAGGA